LVFALIRFMSREEAPPMAPRAALAPLAVGFIGLVGTMVLQYIAFASMPVIEANLVAYTWPLMVAPWDLPSICMCPIGHGHSLVPK